MSHKDDDWIVPDRNGNHYFVNCPKFRLSIGYGEATPHTGELDINKEYIHKHQRNNVCIDVGGHIGTHCIPYSKLFDRVYTFEANEENYSYLVRNIDLNKRTNITAYNKAVSDTKRKASVKQMDTHNTGQFAVIDDANGSLETVTIDEFQIQNVDFIKIDVEGRELDVIKGASETINKYKPLLQVEFSHLSDDVFGISKEDTINYISNLGYVVFRKIHADTFFIDKEEHREIYENSVQCPHCGEWITR
jgi:FkbM family methyltransferase